MINENAMRQMALQVAATQTNDASETIEKATVYLAFLMVSPDKPAQEEQPEVDEQKEIRFWSAQ